MRRRRAVAGIMPQLLQGELFVSEDGVKCPKCGSTQIQAGKRGWSFWTGMIGMNKITLTCLSCGNKFSPGEGI
jgi:predicted RNA-binding Zn-ribbon protein involved in translation (DUF1610 family)